MNINFKLRASDTLFDLQYLEIDHREECLPLVRFGLAEQITQGQPVQLLYYVDSQQPTAIATGSLTLATDSCSSLARTTTYCLEYTPTFPPIDQLYSVINTKELHRWYFTAHAQILNYTLASGTAHGSDMLAVEPAHQINATDCLNYRIATHLQRTHRNLRVKIVAPWEYVQGEYLDFGLLLAEKFNTSELQQTIDPDNTLLRAVRNVITRSAGPATLSNNKANRTLLTFAHEALVTLLRTYQSPRTAVIRADSQVLGIVDDRGCGAVYADLILDCNHRTSVDEQCQFTLTNPFQQEHDAACDNLLVRVNPHIARHDRWIQDHNYQIDDHVVANRAVYRCTRAHRSSTAFFQDHADDNNPWERDIQFELPDWYLTANNSQVVQAVANYAGGLILRNARTREITLTLPLQSMLDYRLGDTIRVQIDHNKYQGLVARLHVKCTATEQTCLLKILCFANNIPTRRATPSIISISLQDQPAPDPFGINISISRALINPGAIDQAEQIDIQFPQSPTSLKRNHRAHCDWEIDLAH